MSRTLLIIKPDAIKKDLIDYVLEELNKNNFKMIKNEETIMTKQTCSNFFKNFKKEKYYFDLINFMAYKTCVTIILEKVNAVEDLMILVEKLRKNNINKDARIYEDLFYIPKTDSQAKRDVDFFFGRNAYLI